MGKTARKKNKEIGGQAMTSKEEIEKAYWEGYIAKQNEAMEICKQCKYIKKVRQLESKLKKYELETIPSLGGEISTSKQVHEYDVQMIDQVKRKSGRII